MSPPISLSFEMEIVDGKWSFTSEGKRKYAHSHLDPVSEPVYYNDVKKAWPKNPDWLQDEIVIMTVLRRM
jgi:hypothetical protein